MAVIEKYEITPKEPGFDTNIQRLREYTHDGVKNVILDLARDYDLRYLKSPLAWCHKLDIEIEVDGEAQCKCNATIQISELISGHKTEEIKSTRHYQETVLTEERKYDRNVIISTTALVCSDVHDDTAQNIADRVSRFVFRCLLEENPDSAFEQT